MRVSVVIKDIADSHAPHSHRQAIDVPVAGQLIGAVLDGLLLATEPKSLAKEVALWSELGEVSTCLLLLPIGEARQPLGGSEPKTLVEFRVEVEFIALQAARTEKSCAGPRLSSLSPAGQALWALIRRPEAWVGLFDESALAVNVPARVGPRQNDRR